MNIPNPPMAADVARPRSVPVVVLALVALVAALLASTLSGEHAANAHTDGHADLAVDGRHAAVGGPLNAREAAFQDDMRKLWEDHVTWTRLAIVTFVDGSPGFDASATRLLQNQQDIGDAIKPFYGDAAGERLSALLTDHIAIAVDLLTAARDSDAPAVDEAVARWYENADDIAGFLAGANPTYWEEDSMRDAMRSHLDQTLSEATHELNGDYAAGVADYDEIHAHILAMADVLSNGIMRTFPRSFR